MSPWSAKNKLNPRQHPIRIKPYRTVFKTVIALLFILNISLVASEDGYTEAQLLLLGTPHLNNLSHESLNLFYHLSRNGNNAFTGTAIGQISAPNTDGGRDAYYTFNYSGNKKSYPKVIGFNSNPLVMYFLEWDLEETLKTTPQNYTKTTLRNKVRLAMWKTATVEKTDIAYKGRTYPAKRIVIKPYIDSEMDSPVKTRQYEFVVSEGIPGGFKRLSSIYEINGNEIITLINFDHVESPKK